MTPLRSVLYVPASNDRALDKARTLPCDAVILDLEDAVAPEAKDRARDLAVHALRAGFEGRTAVLRVNAAGTPWAEADFRAAMQAGPHAVLAPKVETARDVEAYTVALGAAPVPLGLWVMIETPAAVLNLPEIAAAAEAEGSRLCGLVLGLNDLATATGARLTPGRAPFQSILTAAVTAARAYGLTVLDAVFNDLEDDLGFADECLQASDFGFDGKTLIHPRQIEPANRAFSPADAELAWARAVSAAFADPTNAGQGVLRVQGGMVERLHLQQAERLLAMAGAQR